MRSTITPVIVLLVSLVKTVKPMSTIVNRMTAKTIHYALMVSIHILAFAMWVGKVSFARITLMIVPETLVEILGDALTR